MRADDDNDSKPKSNYVQKCTMLLTATIFAMLAVIIALTGSTFTRLKNQQVVLTTLTTPYPSVGLPGYPNLAWSDVVAAVSGQTVRFSSCVTCGRYNKMIDTFVIPQLKQVYGINMIRVPQAAADAVTQVETQIAQGVNNGSIDMIWINLENFARLSSKGNAYGPWATLVPSAANFNSSDTSVFFDGGLPTNGFEIPYDGAQCAFIYNQNLITSQTDLVNIRTIAGIQQWLIANKGMFTYAVPSLDGVKGTTSDYTGSAFVRHVFYALSGPYTDFLGSSTVNLGLYNQRAPKTFAFLRAIEPYLYSDPTFAGNAKTYPATTAVTDMLFAQMKIALTMSYDPGHAAVQLALTTAGSWNLTNPQGYILTTGTLANTNYIAIPINAANKLAAVVAANYLASPAAQFYRFVTLGALQVFDPTGPVFTTGGWNTAFDSIPNPPSTPPRAIRAAGRLGELSAAYINKIQADWFTCVLSYTGPNANTPQCG